MQSGNLNSYIKLIDLAGKYCNRQKPDSEKILKSLGFEGIGLHAQAPVFYIVDYSKNKYLYIDSSCKTVFDYSMDKLTKEGPLFLSGLWHKNDLKIFNEKIFPQEMNFLKKQPGNDYSDFSFSFNYRIRSGDGNWRTILQRTTYISASDDKKPTAAIVFITDISQYKDDSRIIHTVEKMNRDCDAMTHESLIKSVYYPDKQSNVLSRREMEILKLVYEGLSSKKIAEKLFISINTINNHRKNMLQKTHSKNTSELLGFALKNGLFSEIIYCALASI